MYVYSRCSLAIMMPWRQQHQQQLFSILLLLLFVLVTLKCCEAGVDQDQLSFRYHECNEKRGNFSSNGSSNYQKNRDAVLREIYLDKEIDYGFYNLSYGEDPDRVNAIGLCRGDIGGADECRSCLKYATLLLHERCPVQKEAIGYYDLCMLRYSPDPIFGDIMETQTSKVYIINNANSTGVDGDPYFNQTLQVLLDRLKTKAAEGGDSRRKFAEDSVPVPAASSSSSNESTIYALLQCTPDLSEQNCTGCFDSAFSDISTWCGRKGMKGCLYLGPSCSVRYDITQFFNVPAPAPAPAPQQYLPPPNPKEILVSPPLPGTGTTKGGGKSKTATVVAIVVSVAVIGVLLVVICCLYLRAVIRKRTRHTINDYIQGEGQNEEPDEVDNDIDATELSQFDFATIRFATNNFSEENKLGQGGFGTVYKGILSDGQEVAIKRLSNSSQQGETEFKNEVLLTGKLQHRNLVKLLGFCLQRGERLLIYEFVPNKSLDYIIFDPIKRANLDWEMRYKIIRGIGRGLLYLHEDSRLQIVHRDLKISNILLDEELTPKISDFGIARLFDANQTQGNTKNVVGTFGYMAPEYIRFGDFSVKSDVFSFGVIILEIICGQRNTQMRVGDRVEDLLSIAWKNWRAETSSDIVDPIILNNGCKNEIMRCIHIGLLCVQEEIDERPTMNSVLLMLNSTSFPLGEPSEPPFLMQPKRISSILSIEQYSGATRSSDSGTQPTQGSTSTNSSAVDLNPW